MSTFRNSTFCVTGGIFLIVILLFATAYKAHLNKDRSERFRERDQKIKAAFELGREVSKRMSTSFKPNVTLDEFQKDFGPVSKLEDLTDPKYAEKTHLFFHEKSQRKFYLRFDDNGLLVGSVSNHGSDDIDTGVVLESDEYLMGENVRRATLLLALLVWCIILFLSIFLKSIRNNAAAVLIFTSILSGLCWFLSPGYTPTFYGVVRNDSLCFFLVMFAVSISFFFANRTVSCRKMPDLQ